MIRIINITLVLKTTIDEWFVYFNRNISLHTNVNNIEMEEEKIPSERINNP